MGQDKNQESDSALSESENSVIDKSDGPYVEINKTEKKHKCTYAGCNAIFLRPSRLARHIRSHTGERPYKCSHSGCDKAYTNSTHLKRHMETHSITKRTYQCSQCSLLISNRHNLKRHYDRVHRNPSRLTCKECDVTFTKKHQLISHLAAHHTTSYKCDKCNKSFTDIRKFKRHEATHDEGTKRYPCTIAGCTEVFGKWALRCAHMKTQHVINYKCNGCDKVFLTKSHLRIHSQVHMENRPVIPCPYEKCHRVYYFKSNLEHHIRISHLGKKFQCDICDIKISSKQKLAEHIQKIHMAKKRVKKTKKSQRKKRKDIGIPKRSVVSALIGVNLPPKVEKMILKRESNVICLEENKETSSDNLNS